MFYFKSGKSLRITELNWIFFKRNFEGTFDRRNLNTFPEVSKNLKMNFCGNKLFIINVYRVNHMKFNRINIFQKASVKIEHEFLIKLNHVSFIFKAYTIKSPRA